MSRSPSGRDGRETRFFVAFVLLIFLLCSYDSQVAFMHQVFLDNFGVAARDAGLVCQTFNFASSSSVGEYICQRKIFDMLQLISQTDVTSLEYLTFWWVYYIRFLCFGFDVESFRQACDIF